MLLAESDLKVLQNFKRVLYLKLEMGGVGFPPPVSLCCVWVEWDGVADSVVRAGFVVWVAVGSESEVVRLAFDE